MDERWELAEFEDEEAVRVLQSSEFVDGSGVDFDHLTFDHLTEERRNLW
jgi:hypothetical protein